MAQTYKTADGDVLDAIVFQQYGQCTAAMLAQVLDANRGLAQLGAILPAGVLIELPDFPATTEDTGALSLWD